MSVNPYGRPKLPPELYRGIRLRIPLRIDEDRRIREAAAAAGLTRSEWARRILFAEATKTRMRLKHEARLRNPSPTDTDG